MKKFSCLAAASLGAALSFLAWTSLISEAQAVPISIQNPGFDDNSGVNANGFDSSSNNVNGWRDGGSTPGGGVYASASAASAPNVACTGPGQSVPFQLTNYVIQARDVFTLTYYATSGYQNSRASVRLLKTNLPFTGGVAPVTGGLVNATLNDSYSATSTMAYSSPNTTATWTKYTLTYTATTADAGKIVGVAMDSAFGGYPNYDQFALGVTHPFVHPGIDLSQADCDRIRTNATQAPFAAIWASWLGQGYFSYNTTYSGNLPNDATAASCNAQAFIVTGDNRYRDNAISIMNQTAQKMTSFDVYDHLTAGAVSWNLCNAGELIRSAGNGAWAASDITAFQTMLTTYLLPALVTPGNSYQGANHIGADGNLEYAGHGIVQMQGLIPMGIFCDRPDIYSFGVNYFQHNSNQAMGVQDYVNANGLNYETARDCGHPSGAIGTLTVMSYNAWNQGLDLFAVGNNLLAKASEVQAQVNMNYEVAPGSYVAHDGGSHNSISAENRTAIDGMRPALLYRIYHDIKGLALPYTFMSLSLRGIDPRDTTVPIGGQAYTAPAYGAPAPTDVVCYSDNNFSGDYLVHLAPGNYTLSALGAAGITGGPWGNGSGTMRSMKIPSGWTVTAYDSDNFSGSSIVINSTQGSLSNIGWGQRIVSVQISSAGQLPYPVFDGTYRIVSKSSGKVVEVMGSSTADGANVDQVGYSGQPNQLWSITKIGAGQYKILNLNSGKAMEVAAASLANGGSSPTAAGNVDQTTYVPAPNLATGGTASASSGNTGNESSAMAFDANSGTKWNSQVSSPTGWLQYQLATAKVVNQYTLTSAGDAQERDPSAWQFLGSSDGVNWTILDTRSGQIFAGRGQTLNYSFNSTTAYTYYRLNITANYGGSNYNLQLADMGFYSTTGGGIHQRWTMTAASGSNYASYLKILNVNSGKALDVYGNSTADGANIMQWTDNGGNNQQWSLLLP